MKFLFTSTPLLCHFLPMVPLIRAARAAGHEVMVATGSDLRYAGTVSLYGWSVLGSPRCGPSYRPRPAPTT